MIKIIFAAFILGAPAFAAHIDKVRVFEKAEGPLILLYVNDAICKPGESGDQCFDRVKLSDCPESEGACLPGFDILKASVPARGDRLRWRKKAGVDEIEIDITIPETGTEKKAAAWERMKSTETATAEQAALDFLILKAKGN